MIYSQQKLLGASLCDAQSKLSYLGAFALVEDSLTELMRILQADGITVRNRYGALLVFSKNRLKFFRMPDWGDQVTVESFVSGILPLRVYVDTYIKLQGEICVASRIEMCAVDIATGRIRKTETYGLTEQVEVLPPSVDIEYSRRENVSGVLVDRVKVKSTNIDYCRHTNNVEYVRFLLNCFSVQQLESKPIKEMQISYVNQSHEGDALSIFRSDESDKTYLYVEKEGQPILSCQLYFDLPQ